MCGIARRPCSAVASAFQADLNKHTHTRTPHSFRSRKVKVGDEWFWEVLEPQELQPAKHVVEETFSGQGMDALFSHLEGATEGRLIWPSRFLHATVSSTPTIHTGLAQQPLRQPADAPAFEFALVRSARKKGPAAVVARVNHAIGDGISLARLIPCVTL